MNSKNVSQFVVTFLLTNQLLVSPASAFISDLGQESTNDSKKIVNPKSVTVTPKWSLPFQGQLEQASAKSVKTNTLSGDLQAFTPKKVQVLSISAPPALIADSTTNNISTGNDTKTENGKFIAGGVSVWDGPFDCDRIINHLLDMHFQNSPEGKKLEEQSKKHAGLGHRAIACTKDGLEETLGYQGFAPSMRGGQIVIDDPKMKIRNVAWADYVRQRYIDKIHAQVVSNLMQLAEGIGNSENERGAKTVATAKENLAALVGNEEAERAVKALTIWLNSTNVPYSTFAQAPWTTNERNKKLETILKTAVNNDPVIIEITKRVMKYANPGKYKLAASQVIQTTLNGITVFSPGFIPSISSGALQVAFKLSTGGTEQNKLERELLFDKRIQSRLKVLTDETSMALDNYRFALVTKNPPLLAFSQEVLENLTGSPKVQSLLASASIPNQDYDSSNRIVPGIKDENASKPAQAKSGVGFVVKNLGQMTVTDFKNYDN